MTDDERLEKYLNDMIEAAVSFATKIQDKWADDPDKIKDVQRYLDDFGAANGKLQRLQERIKTKKKDKKRKP